MVYIGLHEVSVRVGVRYVNQIFSEESLPNFLTHGAPLRARERELRYYHSKIYKPDLLLDVGNIHYISREDKGDREGILHTHPIP